MPDQKECELCGNEEEYLSGCSKCGKMICSSCEAATDEDEEEIVCEACF